MLAAHRLADTHEETGLEFDQVRAFLLLSEELHFGRTADRLYRSQSRISRLIASLETEVGAVLFERTSRQVRLTPLGTELAARLRPAYDEMLAALHDVATSARSVAGCLRIGATQMTDDSPSLDRLVRAFVRRYPECEARIVEVDVWEPYAPLRSGEIDVLCNWLAVDEPDLHIGPIIEERERFLAVGARHRLAQRASVSVEDLADERVQRAPARYPSALLNALLPSNTPSGRPIPIGDREVDSAAEVLMQVAHGEIVGPTVSTGRYKARRDIVLVPITDMPPIPLGLIWCTARQNARIRALAEIAPTIRPTSATA
jgi:DNA-binding transcriptional LysR family regulator